MAAALLFVSGQKRKERCVERRSALFRPGTHVLQPTVADRVLDMQHGVRRENFN